MTTILIPNPLKTDRCCPVESAEGTDPADFGEQGVPGRAAGVEDVVVARPETVREEALAQIQPDPLDRVQLGGVGWQEQRREVGWDGEVLGDVPAGAVHQHDRMSAGADGLAELVEHRPHD